MQFPTVLQFHSAFRRHPPLLLLKVPHRQNRHPKQKEKKNPTNQPKEPQGGRNISSANIFTVAICLQEISEAAWQWNKLKEWRAFSYFKMKLNLSCITSTDFISELMQVNIATVFEKFKNSIQNAKSKHFMNFNIHLEISKLALSSC